MSTVSDEQLLQHAQLVRGRVVVITGGASGFGKESALLYSQYGGKVVIGDLNLSGAESVAKGINDSGGEALALKCNVLSWDDQVAMFEAAMQHFGSIDIVIPNAGISESENMFTGNLEMQLDGRPSPPSLLTSKINLDGVAYTMDLGIHYMKRSHSKLGPSKSIVLLGSMSSWQSMPSAPLYSASKHAMLGLMRSLHPTLAKDNIRISVVTPFFSETAIIETPEAQTLLKDVPLVPVARVAKAIFHCSTNPDLRTSGSVWVLPDNGPVLKMGRESLNEGAYKIINARIKSML